MIETAITKEYWITNLKTKVYMPVYAIHEDFSGEWKEHYPHTEKVEWTDVAAYSVWSDETAAGIPFIYDLSRNGGHFMLLVDINQHGPEDIEKAKQYLRCNRDVVTLRVKKLRKYDQ